MTMWVMVMVVVMMIGGVYVCGRTYEIPIVLVGVRFTVASSEPVWIFIQAGV